MSGGRVRCEPSTACSRVTARLNYIGRFPKFLICPVDDVVFCRIMNAMYPKKVIVKEDGIEQRAIRMD